jgi:hypothetical protein
MGSGAENAGKAKEPHERAVDIVVNEPRAGEGDEET